NGFLREDIGVDITTFFGQKPFEYIYAPRTDSDNPRVLLCRRDGSLPQEADIKVSEIFSPIVYAVYSSGASALDDQTVFHEKLNPTKYKVSFGNVDRDSVLVFNSRFSTLWKLYDSNTGGVMDDHFVVDGYANGWLIKKGDQRNFSLVYQPQIWFEKGRIISVFFLSTTVLIYIWLGYFKKRKQK
ncbi:MAG: hypothetical protein NTV24_04880, partial [Candidatus Woesebacteria bacterium]|nr:hypothetical protein [Candidatus Woesebacteria bacterium]